VEAVVLLAEGYHWHWDTAGAGLDAFGYRKVLVALPGGVGFAAAPPPGIRSFPVRDGGAGRILWP
jgi:hypothetical protein